MDRRLSRFSMGGIRSRTAPCTQLIDSSAVSLAVTEVERSLWWLTLAWSNVCAIKFVICVDLCKFEDRTDYSFYVLVSQRNL